MAGGQFCKITAVITGDKIMKKIVIRLLLPMLPVLLLRACQHEQPANQTQSEHQTFRGKVVTSWPKDLPGLGTSAEHFAQVVNELSAGRLQIKVYGAGELVPALEVFDAVSQGTAEMGHSSPYYWKGKAVAAQFFTTV